MATKKESTKKALSLEERLVSEVKKSDDQKGVDRARKDAKQARIVAAQELFNKENDVNQLRERVEALNNSASSTLEQIVNAETELEAEEAILEAMQAKNDERFPG